MASVDLPGRMMINFMKYPASHDRASPGSCETCAHRHTCSCRLFHSACCSVNASSLALAVIMSAVRPSAAPWRRKHTT